MRRATPLLGFLALLLPACAAESPRAITVERTDSAGVTIVRNLGADVPLPWTFAAAFLPDGKIAAIEKDALDVQRVVVYRVEQGGTTRR